MKTSVIDVRGMLSALSADRVEKRIGTVPGVESVTVNDAAGNATVRYDDTLLEIADIKAAVHQSEYQSAGESEPRHESEQSPARKRAAVPTPDAAPASASTPAAAAPKASTIAPAVVPAPAAPAVGAAPGAPPATPVATAPKAAPVAPVTPPAAPARDGQQDKAAPDAPPSPPVAATPKPSPVAPAPVVPAAGPAPPALAVGGHQDHAAPDAKPPTPVAAAPKAVPVAPAAVPAPAAKSSTPATAEPKADVWKVHAFSLATTLGVAYISCAIFDVLFPPFGLLAALAARSPLPISGSPLAFLTGFALFTVAGFVLGALYGIASKFWSKRLR